MYFEVEFTDGFSIACKGVRIPSIEEAKIFCAAEIKKCGEVLSVIEIPYEEVEQFFDTENINKWPVFGQ